MHILIAILLYVGLSIPFDNRVRRVTIVTEGVFCYQAQDAMQYMRTTRTNAGVSDTFLAEELITKKQCAEVSYLGNYLGLEVERVQEVARTVLDGERVVLVSAYVVCFASRNQFDDEPIVECPDTEDQPQIFFWMQATYWHAQYGDPI